MEVLNHNTFQNMRLIKTEPELILLEDDEDDKEMHASLRLNGAYKVPQYSAIEEIEVKPETYYYENNTSESYYNGYTGNSVNVYDEWSQADSSIKYEYQEPEENFISVDDLKVKPFLFDMMRTQKNSTDCNDKQNYESAVKNEDISDDDVILIEDDDIDENEAGEDWMDLEDEEKQSFECFLCNKKVASNYNLRRHMMIHTGERPFGCDICLKRFREFSDLKKHRKVHINEQGFTCMVCRENAPSLKNSTKCSSCERQDRHYRTNYGEFTLDDVPCIEGSHKKAFVCPVCDRIFGSRHNLKRHYMIHTGEKPYKCDICEKHFREVSTLKKHMLTHSRIKLFKCITCGKEYSDFGAYNRHKKTHGDILYENHYSDDPEKRGDSEIYLFECGACYKKFSNITVYKEHLKLHSSDCTFQCYICKRMFRTKVKLNAHFVTHDCDDSN